ncbi:MAG: 30S ribosomal protein S2 [Candidatus Marsarchaeota archaeon]|nr:30S ribosomal protein S2 [Candidatus Marsarchaeota archaeon]
MAKNEEIVEGQETTEAEGMEDAAEQQATDIEEIKEEIKRAEPEPQRSVGDFLVDQNEYLEVGIHIATKTRSPGMKKFIYKVREDGLYLLDLKTIDSRIKTAATMLAAYNPKEIVVTASRIYAIYAAEKFASIIGATFIKGRVTPGIFTNPHRQDYMEPKLILISDSRNEKQAVKEASMKNVPIIALSDTDNSTKFVDLIIPANNRGRRSLAFIYFLLAREVMKARGEIKEYSEFQHSVQEFEAKVEGGRTPIMAERSQV